MKAIVVERVGTFTMQEINIPHPRRDEVLVKVSVTGLCRTDLKLITVGHRDLVLPRVPGEEVVGTIAAVGDGVETFEEGQRVYVYPGTSCGVCAPCAAEAGNLCTNMEIMGFHRDGGFADYVTAPARSIIPIPGEIMDEEAVFAEPLSCCLNALELARLKAGETIAIWGGGPAGSLLARAASAKGAIPLVIDPDERRASRSHGVIAPPGDMFDSCIVAVGDQEAYHESLDHLKPRGRLVVFSGLAPDDSRLSIDFNRLHYNEQTIVGAYGCSFRHGIEALAAIADGSVPVKDLISHRMPLQLLGEALSLVESRNCMKIHLYPIHKD